MVLFKYFLTTPFLWVVLNFMLSASSAFTEGYFESSHRGWNFVAFGCNEDKLSECLKKVGKEQKDVAKYFTPDIGSGVLRNLILGDGDRVFATKHSKLRFLLNENKPLIINGAVKGHDTYKYAILVDGGRCNTDTAKMFSLRLLHRGSSQPVGTGRDSLQQWKIRTLDVMCRLQRVHYRESGKPTKIVVTYFIDIINAPTQPSMIQAGFDIEEINSLHGGAARGRRDSLARDPDSLRTAPGGDDDSKRYEAISDISFGPDTESGGASGMSSAYGAMSDPQPMANSVQGGKAGDYGSVPESVPPTANPFEDPQKQNSKPTAAVPPRLPAMPGFGEAVPRGWEYQQQIQGMQQAPPPLHLYLTPTAYSGGKYAGEGKPQGCTVEEYELVYGIMCDLLDAIFKNKKIDLV